MIGTFTRRQFCRAGAAAAATNVFQGPLAAELPSALSASLSNLQSDYFFSVDDGSGKIFSTMGNTLIGCNGAESSVRYRAGESRAGVVLLTRGRVGALAVSESVEPIGPSLLRRTVSITTTEATRYYLKMQYTALAAGDFYSYQNKHVAPARYNHNDAAALGGTLIPVVGVLSPDTFYGVIADCSGFWQNRGSEYLDPAARKFSINAGDEFSSKQIAADGAEYNFEHAMPIRPGEVHRFVTYIFKASARGLYDIQLASHIAFADAKGWRESAVEAITKSTSYMLCRQNLLNWGNDAGVIFMSGVSYGWHQWVSDAFYSFLSLGGEGSPEAMALGQSAYNAAFANRILYEDNAQLYIIWSCLIRRGGGTVNWDLLRDAYAHIRRLEVNGAFMPRRAWQRPDGPPNYAARTYFDLMFYEDDDPPSSNQGFHGAALMAAMELGLGAAETDVDKAAAAYAANFNAAGGYLATSLRKQHVVSQDVLMGEALAFALFGRRLLSDAIVQQHIGVVDRFKTKHGLRVFCDPRGGFLTQADYGVPGSTNPYITVPGDNGRYVSGGSWFLADMLTYLAGMAHGMNLERQQLWRIRREMQDSPSFKEYLNTSTGLPGGDALYCWNGAYVYLRARIRSRLGLAPFDSMLESVDLALGVRKVNGHLVLNPGQVALLSPGSGPDAIPAEIPRSGEVLVPRGTTEIDATDARVRYGGPWSTNLDRRPLGGSQRQSGEIGSTASLRFIGDWVEVAYASVPNMAVMQVFVDGRLVSAVDCEQAGGGPMLVRCAGLGRWSHEVVVRHAGRGRASGAAPQIAVSAFRVPGLVEIDDSNPRWDFAGSWVAGRDGNCLQGSQRYSFGPGDVALLPYFRGDAVEVVYYTAPNMGIMEILIDENLQAVIDCHGPTRYRQYARVSSWGAGGHKLRIRHGGRGSAPTASTYIAFDAVVLQNL